MANSSFQNYATIPSAIVSDGIVVIPLWAVTQISLTETYHLPPIGSSGAKALVATHDDSVTLQGVLVGPERFTWKLMLETLADEARRGSALSTFTGGKVGGLILVTSMTIRTDMQAHQRGGASPTAPRVPDDRPAPEHVPQAPHHAVQGSSIMGMIYTTGTGVTRDEAKGRTYWDKACKLGYAPACKRLEGSR